MTILNSNLITISKNVKNYENYNWFSIKIDEDLDLPSEDDFDKVIVEVLLNLPFENTGIFATFTNRDFTYYSIFKENNTVFIEIGNAFGTKLGFKEVITFEPNVDIKEARYTLISGFTVAGNDVGDDGIGPEPPVNVLQKINLESYKMLLKILTNILSKESIAYSPIQKVKKSSSAKNRKKFIEWHTVVIKPKVIVRANLGGTHASPRFHERRGHWRTFKSGKKTWINSMKVGKPENGIILKDYVVQS